MATTIEERIDMFESTEKGEEVWRIERRMGWRARTIRKWRQRGHQQGRAGLASQMGRPRQGVRGSFPPEISATLRRWRQANPGWGAITLRAELERHPAFGKQALPSRATIGRFLAEEGLIVAKEPVMRLPDTTRTQAGKPHAVWEMDARGYEKVADVGFVTLIHLNDRFSHARLLSYPCWLGQQRVERHANTADYQAALRIAFMEWGLPHTLQVDHESVFYDNRSKSPFPSRLHLWLVALGVSLTFMALRDKVANRVDHVAPRLVI